MEGEFLCGSTEFGKVWLAVPRRRQAGYPGVMHIVASMRGALIGTCCLGESPSLYCSLPKLTLEI
jgi:hypothetical protein